MALAVGRKVRRRQACSACARYAPPRGASAQNPDFASLQQSYTARLLPLKT
jgi:hypothetical protein